GVEGEHPLVDGEQGQPALATPLQQGRVVRGLASAGPVAAGEDQAVQVCEQLAPAARPGRWGEQDRCGPGRPQGGRVAGGPDPRGAARPRIQALGTADADTDAEWACGHGGLLSSMNTRGQE